MKDQETTEKKVVVVEKHDLPLVFSYKEKKYVLILTKNDKLILNKYED